MNIVREVQDDGSPVPIFEFTANTPAKRNLLPLAKNALSKLRTTRHPDALKFLDGAETDTGVHIMTERVRPLCTALEEASSKNAQELEDWILWGLHRISIALAFINESCASTHGNVWTDSAFLSPSGEWELGGFEVLSNPKDDAAVLYTPADPPSSGWPVVEDYMRKHDDRMIKDFADDIDTLLVFAGLFSGVLTAFVAQSYQSLLPDTAQLSVNLLEKISTQLDSGTDLQRPTTTNVPASSVEPFIAPVSAVTINTLWFLSLVFSLAAALFGILAKQWLREYLQWDSVLAPPRENVLLALYSSSAEWLCSYGHFTT
ncbi:hypothetical protein NM688_g8605 [Phlebia brevispora]|uniref:Uncharacterized protein n=1 Tax=Phlebia brevispora TaxID=194682 RepID=A0ACC1RR62_9APHY|nr:hypothetical protein NM688_g8605 [Phlebia brevispora]